MTDRPSTTEVAEQDTEARWRAQIAKELRGRTFESLLAKSEDGLQIEPLYTGRHLEELDCLDPFPGRGLNARGFASRRDGHWKICPELALDDPQMLVHMAAEQAALGADVAWCRFVPTPGPRVGRDNSGIRGCSLRAVASSIAGVAAAKLPLIVETGAVASPIAAAMERHGDTFSGVSLTIDLFGDRAARGVVAASREVIEEELRACLSWVKDREGTDVRLLCATQPFHEAGATAAQELGIAMSLLVGTLRQVEDSGADFEQALRALLIRVSVGRDLFTEIAKLRAVRVLWSQVMGACGFGTMHHEVEIAARGSWRERTAVDPWVNLLRGTTETFAAAVGGASMITTVPMHAALPGESEMARRLATNTQVLLRRESHVGEVMDTAGGSYYVEWLTNGLALEGWKWFQRIEACGGIATALQTNAIHEWIAEKRGAQDQRVADRTLAIIGVSDFPASGSSAPRDYRVPSPSRRGGGASHLIPRWSRSRPIISRASVLEDATLGNAWDALAQTGAREAVGVQLPHERLSAPFEVLRAQVQRMPSAPCVVLVCVGGGPVVEGRADFAANVVGVLGLEVRRRSLEEARRSVGMEESARADVAVLCTDDSTLDARVDELLGTMREGVSRQTVVAASPRPVDGEGPDMFLYRGANIVQFLSWVLRVTTQGTQEVAR